jgi:hypothetical protein
LKGHRVAAKTPLQGFSNMVLPLFFLTVCYEFNDLPTKYVVDEFTQWIIGNDSRNQYYS